jgi:hypothetical protein
MNDIIPCMVDADEECLKKGKSRVPGAKKNSIQSFLCHAGEISHLLPEMTVFRPDPRRLWLSCHLSQLSQLVRVGIVKGEP